MIWARGFGPLYKVEGMNISTSNKNKGMARVQLLKNTQIDDELPKDATYVDVLADNVHVPGNETTYWCHIHKLPNELLNKHHVLRVSIKQSEFCVSYGYILVRGNYTKGERRSSASHGNISLYGTSKRRDTYLYWFVFCRREATNYSSM